jgi:outer membrane protein TolC
MTNGHICDRRSVYNFFGLGFFMLKYVGIALVILLCLVHESTAGTRDLSLDEAIEIALKQNKNILVAKLNVQKAESQVTEAYGSAMPSVSFNAGFNHNIQLPVFFFPSPITGEVAPLRIGQTNVYSMTAQVQQVLFNGAVFTAVRSSKLYTDAATAQLDAAVAEVVTETKKKYYQAIAAGAYYSVAQSTLDNVKQTRETISALFAEGLVAEFDKIRADVAVANVEPIVIEASSSKYAAQAALQTYLSLDMSDTLVVSADRLPEIEDAPNPDDALVKALEANLDLKALSLQIEVAKKMIDIQASDYYPTLAAFGQWQQQGQSDKLNDWRSATSSLVGINFSMNLFNGLRTKAKVEQSELDVATALQRKSQISDLIRLQTRTIVNQLSSAKARITAQASTVNQAQRGYDISQIRYKEGTGSLLEISDAETALSRAQVNEISARLDYHTTKAEYDRVTGQIDERYRRMVK